MAAAPVVSVGMRSPLVRPFVRSSGSRSGGSWSVEVFSPLQQGGRRSQRGRAAIRAAALDTPQNSRVLISGASIAGPALAFWLDRYGFDVTVVEKANGVRRGGQPVDFKGATHMTVLDRMGILEDVRQARAPAGGDWTVVDADGRKVASIPSEFGSGDIEISRSDLSQILLERSAASCEYVFGDSITSLTETGDGVEVAFQRSAPRVFDLVIGADGIHSNVRSLAFGPESDYVQHLGYYYAIAEIRDEVAREDAMYNEPGRVAATTGAEGPSIFVFASDPLEYDRDDVQRQKQLLVEAYSGGAWKVPALMAAIPAVEEFYMNPISRVTIDRYSSGRVALVGDSAYGNALGGFGTGLAVVGAYVLAGELHRAGGDYKVAYAQYAARFRKYANVSQTVNAGELLAPTTRFGLFVRNRMFSVAPLFMGVMKLMDHFATDIDLVDYSRDTMQQSVPALK